MASEAEKTERFKKVAEARTNRIIDQLRLLGNCSNKSNYQYSDEDVKKIFQAIEAELKNTKTKFLTKTENEKFKL